MLDITEAELRFCAEWVRSGDAVAATRAGGTMRLGKDPTVLAEMALEKPEVAYVVSLMRMAVAAADVAPNIEDEKENRQRLVGEIIKARSSAAKDREHESVMRSIELEGKTLGLMIEKKDIAITAQLKEPSKLSLSEMRRLLDNELVDVTPGGGS